VTSRNFKTEVKGSIVNAFYFVLASIRWKLSAFTRYSCYILQVRWINL